MDEKDFLEELSKAKAEILAEVRMSNTQVEALVSDMLPKHHDEIHEEIRRFIERSPDAKTHGEHHDFTSSVKSKMEYMVISIFKGLGSILLIALLIGLYTWVTHQVGVTK